MHSIVGLQTFMSYTVVVAAKTSVGVGPYSSPIHVKTDEDGMFDQRQHIIIANIMYKRRGSQIYNFMGTKSSIYAFSCTWRL